MLEPERGACLDCSAYAWDFMKQTEARDDTASPTGWPTPSGPHPKRGHALFRDNMDCAAMAWAIMEGRRHAPIEKPVVRQRSNSLPASRSNSPPSTPPPKKRAATKAPQPGAMSAPPKAPPPRAAEPRQATRPCATEAPRAPQQPVMEPWLAHAYKFMNPTPPPRGRAPPAEKPKSLPASPLAKAADGPTPGMDCSSYVWAFMANTPPASPITMRPAADAKDVPPMALPGSASIDSDAPTRFATPHMNPAPGVAPDTAIDI